MAKNVREVDHGWRQLKKGLSEINHIVVDVGVQAGDQEANGFDMARLAALHEFGDTIEQEARSQLIYHKINKQGDFLRRGRFVKVGQSNFARIVSAKARTIHIPSRPFMRSSFDENMGKIDKFAQDAIARAVIAKISFRQALDLIGQKMTGLIQRKIVSGPWTPNAPSTIKKKKSSRPLIDTGRLRQSIRHVVRRR